MKKFLFREVGFENGERFWGEDIVVEAEKLAPPYFNAALEYGSKYGRRAKELRLLKVIDEDGTEHCYRHYVFDVRYESFFDDREDGIYTEKAGADAPNIDDAIGQIETRFKSMYSRLICVKFIGIEYGF